jgi:hypothetical protein
VNALAIVLGNLAALAGAVFGVVRSGERPQVLLYAFIYDCVLRLFTIETLTQPFSRYGWLTRVAPLISSPPADGQQSSPFIDEETKRPIGFGGYVVVIAFLAVLTFVLSHVNAEREIEIDLTSFSSELRWGLALGLMYWLQSVASRAIVIDPGASREINFGYNVRELVVFAFAVLTAGAVVMIRQIAGRPPTGWVVLGPLLAFRFLFDLLLGLRLAKTRAPRD